MGVMGKLGKWLKKVKNVFRFLLKDVIDDKDEIVSFLGDVVVLKILIF